MKEFLRQFKLDFWEHAIAVVAGLGIIAVSMIIVEVVAK